MSVMHSIGFTAVQKSGKRIVDVLCEAKSYVVISMFFESLALDRYNIFLFILSYPTTFSNTISEVSDLSGNKTMFLDRCPQFCNKTTQVSNSSITINVPSPNTGYLFFETFNFVPFPQ